MLYSRPKVVAMPELPENIEKWKKAKDIHSKMAIYFDENFYSEKRNDNNCYRYMYLIYYMLACGKKYFHNYEDYDEYAQFAATTIYIRFLKKLENGERIKSILNYAKSTLYPLKVMYQNDSFRTVVDEEHDPRYNSVSFQQMLRDNIQAQYYKDELDKYIVDVFKEIPRMIKERILLTPYKQDKLMVKKIYMSCLLSFLSSITLSNESLERINNKLVNNLYGVSEDYICKLYNRERESGVILWKLDESMKDFIQVLVNSIRRDIFKEIEESKGSLTLGDNILDAILYSAWETPYSSNNNLDSEEII